MDFSFTTPDFTVLVPSPSVIPSSTIKPSPTPRVLDKKKLWDLVQKFRTGAGYKAYTEDLRLCTIARKRLPEVVTDWSHDGFYKYTDDFAHNGMGENLGRLYETEYMLVVSWINSPTHKENLDKPYKYSCIETDGLYAVQIFANF